VTAEQILYVVDDDPVVSDSLISLVEARSGIACRAFRNGEALLDALDDLAPGCVVLDLELEGTASFKIMSVLSENIDRFRTIVVTGIADLTAAIDAFRLGAVDFLFKPYEVRPLLDAIERAFHLLQTGAEPAALVADAQNRLALLSGEEAAILARLVRGETNQAIADAMALDERMVQIARARALAAIEAPSILAAMRIAAIAGWPPAQENPDT